MIAFSQRSYYVIDNVKTLDPKFQLILKEDRNVYDSFYEFKIRIKDKVRTFTPERVKEYKHPDGKLYMREQLPEDGTPVFMEVIEDGYLRLYFITDKKFQNRFFIKKGAELVEITKEEKGRSNFQRVLRKHWDQCKKTKKLVKLAEYNRTSLKRTVKAHNTCKELYIPHFKIYGSAGVAMIKPAFNFGVEVNSIAVEGVYRNLNYTFELTYTGALGLSIPIKQTNFSLETGARIQAIKGSYITIFSLNLPFDREFKVDLDLIDINLPIDIQYTVPNLKYRPFFKAGFSPSFLIKNNAEIEERIVATGGNGDQTRNASEEIKNFGIAFNLAMGFQQQINDTNEVFITFGYQRRGAPPKSRIYNFTSFYVMMGYGF